MRQRNISSNDSFHPSQSSIDQKINQLHSKSFELLATCNVLLCFVQCWERICAKKGEREEDEGKKVMGG